MRLSLHFRRRWPAMAAAALGALGVLGASQARALTLDFGGGPTPPSICTSNADGSGAAGLCGNYGWLVQTYGDVAGVADISYSSPRQTTPTSLYWWDSGYNTLYGVAFAPSSDGNSQARIEIKALQPGASVTLSSFDLGAYSNTTRNTTVRVTTLGGGTSLFSYSGAVGDGATAPTHFTPNVTAPGGLWIEFADSAWNVGIDNINYSVGAVPEPATAGMMVLGAAALLLGARRRRA